VVFFCCLILVLFIFILHKYVRKGGDKMNKWQQSIRNHFVNYLGFPKDLLLNLPKITLIGNEQIYIENHDGLISYQSHELIIQTQIGNLKITGSSLSIQELLPSELLMEGEVEEISYVNRGVL